MTDAPLFANARPYTRWWWFSGPIDEAVIRHQLDWAAANGFGGVEIAWMYPQQDPIVAGPERRAVTLHVGRRSLPVELAFAPGASLLVTVAAGGAVRVRSA